MIIKILKILKVLYEIKLVLKMDRTHRNAVTVRNISFWVRSGRIKNDVL